MIFFTFVIMTLIICGLSILDVSLTYKTINLINDNRKLFRLKLIKTADDFECNGLVKFFWKRIGIEKTRILWFIIAPVVLFGLFIGSYFIIPDLSELGIGIGLGMYSTVNQIHISNIQLIKEKIRKRLQNEARNENGG